MVHYQSINHNSHSLGEREALFKQEHQRQNSPHVFLQTCNRIEWYEGEGDVPQEVVRHLFRVAAGLESGLLGEQAILGQVKEAYRIAKEKFRLSASLHKLFLAAITTGKRVRTETAIAQGAVSHSLAAIELLEEEKTDWRKSVITVIGVNKLTEDTLLFLKNKGAVTLFLANRSLEKAQPLADRFGCEIYPLTRKREIMAASDIVLTATSAPHTIINKADIAPLAGSRGISGEVGRGITLVDLAFPRDIDPAVGDIPGVKLFNLEDVESRIRKNLSLRQDEIEKAEWIIETEASRLQEALERRKLYL